MKRAQLKELLRKALYEGPTKQANKEKKSDWMKSQSSDGSLKGARQDPSITGGIRTGRGDRPDRVKPSGFERTADPSRKGDTGGRSADPLQHKQDMLRGAPAKGADARVYPGQTTARPDMTAKGYKAVAQGADAMSRTDQRAGTVTTDRSANTGGKTVFHPLHGFNPQSAQSGGGKTSSVAPEAVKKAASKEAGGKVRFGRYYDAQGKYLGRSQGGQWIDAASDPNAKTQMEMYQKMMEIESGHYSSKDKEMVKEMIREVLKSCK
jgi:hypothetical protein